MAELILMRHATALPATRGATDFERPLSGAGRAEAIRSAHRLARTGLKLQLILYSPARRTRETAAILAEELSLNPGSLHPVPELYTASPRAIRESIERLRGDADIVMVVGHNPGLSELGQQLDSARAHLSTAEFWRLPYRPGG